MSIEVWESNRTAPGASSFPDGRVGCWDETWSSYRTSPGGWKYNTIKTHTVLTDAPKVIAYTKFLTLLCDYSIKKSRQNYNLFSNYPSLQWA